MIPPDAVLTDIEGTTTPIAFVRDTLFGYARARLAAFCEAHPDDPALAAVREHAPREEPVAALTRWMDADAKIAPLKTIQGMIWAQGYAAGDLVGALYEDVPPALRRWARAGIRLFIYSSGSEEAQRRLFRHSRAGDLSGLFQGFFDTRAGAKRVAASYATIARGANVAPAAFLFLSDAEAELDAAAEAGFLTCQLVRPDDHAVAGARHRTAPDFAAVAGLFGLPAPA